MIPKNSGRVGSCCPKPASAHSVPDRSILRARGDEGICFGSDCVVCRCKHIEEPRQDETAGIATGEKCDKFVNGDNGSMGIQGSPKEWAPGCKNFAIKLRQK